MNISMNRIKGILYAAVSSSTFGLAPFFSITLLLAGFSAFEVLSYRWGVAAIVLIRGEKRNVSICGRPEND